MNSLNREAIKTAKKYLDMGDYVMVVYVLKDLEEVKAKKDLHDLAIAYCQQQDICEAEARDFIKDVENL